MMKLLKGILSGLKVWHWKQHIRVFTPKYNCSFMAAC